MADADVEKWAKDVYRNSTAMTASSTSDDHSPVEADEDGMEGPADILTPTISHTSQPPLSRKVTSVQTTGTSDPNFEVDWEDEHDPENPKNFSNLYKGLVIFGSSFGTIAVYVFSKVAESRH